MHDPAVELRDSAGPPAPTDERRSHARGPAPGMISALGEVKDISAGGLRVVREGELPVPVGTAFQLEVQLDKLTVMLPVELVQSQAIDPGKVEMGITFRELSSAQNLQLEAILDRLDAPHELEVRRTPEAAEEAIREAEDLLDEVKRRADTIGGDEQDNTDGEADDEEAQRTWREALTGRKHGFDGDERRRHGRIVAQDAKSTLGVVMDISASGMRVRRKGKGAVAVGESYVIELAAAGMVLRVPVKVIYIRKVAWRSYDFGMAFGNIPEAIRGQFAQLARMAAKAVEIH